MSKSKTVFTIAEPENHLKVLIWGEFKVGKTTLAMKFPKAVIMDLEGGSKQYQKAMGVPGLPIEEGDFESLSHGCQDAVDQGFETIIIDQFSTLYEWHQKRWGDIFLQQEKGKGNKKYYYKMQPSDFVHMKRGWRLYIQGLFRLPVNVVVIARSKNLYSENNAPGQMMQKIGNTYDCEKNLAYELDYIVNVRKEGNNHYCVLGGQRCMDQDRWLPAQFPLNEAMTHFNKLLGVGDARPEPAKPKADAPTK